MKAPKKIKFTFSKMLSIGKIFSPELTDPGANL